MIRRYTVNLDSNNEAEAAMIAYLERLRKGHKRSEIIRRSCVFGFQRLVIGADHATAAVATISKDDMNLMLALTGEHGIKECNTTHHVASSQPLNTMDIKKANIDIQHPFNSNNDSHNKKPIEVVATQEKYEDTQASSGDVFTDDDPAIFSDIDNNTNIDDDDLIDPLKSLGF